MSRELHIVLGVPKCGRTTWINKKLLKENSVIIDANDYLNVHYTKDISDTEIHESKYWCIDEFKKHIDKEHVILCLINNRPDCWLEFLKIAKEYEFEVKYHLPINKLLYYEAKTGSTFNDQYKYLDKFVKNYRNKKGDDEATDNIFNKLVSSLQSSLAFIYTNKNILGNNVEKWIETIESQYVNVISKEQKVEYKVKKSIVEAEKKEDTTTESKEENIESAEENAEENTEENIEEIAESKEEIVNKFESKFKHGEVSYLQVLLSNNEAIHQ